MHNGGYKQVRPSGISTDQTGRRYDRWGDAEGGRGVLSGQHEFQFVTWWRPAGPDHADVEGQVPWLGPAFVVLSLLMLAAVVWGVISFVNWAAPGPSSVRLVWYLVDIDERGRLLTLAVEADPECMGRFRDVVVREGADTVTIEVHGVQKGSLHIGIQSGGQCIPERPLGVVHVSLDGELGDRELDGCVRSTTRAPSPDGDCGVVVRDVEFDPTLVLTEDP